MSEPHGHFRAIEPHAAFTLLLAASSPQPVRDRHRDERTSALRDPWHPGVATPSGRIEAVVAVARAAFAVGGRVVMPGDRGIAPLVAALALDYATLPATERSHQPDVPLVVVETEWPDPTLAALLAPYAIRGAVLHLGPDGEPARLERGWAEQELDPSHAPRQPITPGLLERWHPAGAVLVSPQDDAQRELDLLEERGIPVTAIAHDHREHAERWGRHDHVRLLMSDRPRRWSEFKDAEARPDRGAEATPFAYLSQHIIRGWMR